jgi:hypothetical protein
MDLTDAKLTPRRAASCCWTGPRTTTTPPRRPATSATVQLLRLSRTTRTVTVCPVDPGETGDAVVVFTWDASVHGWGAVVRWWDNKEGKVIVRPLPDTPDMQH